MTIKRIERKEIRAAAGLGTVAEVVPSGLPPVLRSSWRFARDMARRFSQQLLKDHLEDLLKKLRKRFV